MSNRSLIVISIEKVKAGLPNVAILSICQYCLRSCHEIVQPPEALSHPAQSAIHTSPSISFWLICPRTPSSIGAKRSQLELLPVSALLIFLRLFPFMSHTINLIKFNKILFEFACGLVYLLIRIWRILLKRQCKSVCFVCLSI